MATLNGEPVTPAQLEALANVNYGHYTSMRGDKEGVRGLTHHLTRLSRDARCLFGIELDLERVRRLLAAAVAEQAGDGDYGVRITVFDPSLELGRPSRAENPNILVSVRQVPPPAKPLRAQVRQYERDLPEVKHIGLLGAVYERRSAQIAGFDDVLFAARNETVVEGATWNVGFFDGAKVIWPDGDSLTGITMTLLRQVHDDTVIRPIKITELSDMRVAFATNVTVGVRAIAQINDVSYDVNHSILNQLRDEFTEIPPEPLTTAG